METTGNPAERKSLGVVLDDVCDRLGCALSDMSDDDPSTVTLAHYIILEGAVKQVGVLLMLQGVPTPKPPGSV